MSFLSDNFGTIIGAIVGFALAVASVVLGNFLYDTLQERRNSLKLDFETKQETERLGISVTCRHGYLTEARVRCNNVEYEWETAEGTKAQKNILAGDDPSVFYPFKHNAAWIDAKDFSPRLNGIPYTPIVPPEGGPARGAVLLTLIDATTSKKFWNHLFMVGGDAVTVILSPGNALPAEFPIFIKIIAKEIQEEKHYAVGLGAPLQIIDLDREKPIIRYSISLRQRRSWFSPKVKGPVYSVRN